MVKKNLNCMHSQAVWTQKLSDFPYLLCSSASAPYKSPAETFSTIYLFFVDIYQQSINITIVLPECNKTNGLFTFRKDNGQSYQDNSARLIHNGDSILVLI